MAEKFEYNYEAPTIDERKEIESIRSKYVEQGSEKSKIIRLRQLDKKIENIKKITSLTLGIFGLLSFGAAMSFFLEITTYWYLGIPFSIIGGVMMIIAYPIYVKLDKYLKNKYKNEIVSLADEILNNEEKL